MVKELVSGQFTVEKNRKLIRYGDGDTYYDLPDCRSALQLGRTVCGKDCSLQMVFESGRNSIVQCFPEVTTDAQQAEAQEWACGAAQSTVATELQDQIVSQIEAREYDKEQTYLAAADTKRHIAWQARNELNDVIFEDEFHDS